MFKRIKELRQEANYTLEFIANYLNISIENYSKIEQGRKIIKTSQIIKLANLYNTSIDYIVEETDYRYKYDSFNP